MLLMLLGLLLVLLLLMLLGLLLLVLLTKQTFGQRQIQFGSVSESFFLTPSVEWIKILHLKELCEEEEERESERERERERGRREMPP